MTQTAIEKKPHVIAAIDGDMGSVHLLVDNEKETLCGQRAFDGKSWWRSIGGMPTWTDPQCTCRCAACDLTWKKMKETRDELA